VRNVNIILPVLVIPIVEALKLVRIEKKAISIVIILLMSIQIGLNSSAYFQNYNQLKKPDSSTVALSGLSSDVPPGVLVGVNFGCSGPTPAQNAGYEVQEDPFMLKSLDYYLFSSYYDSSIFKYYSQRNILYTPNYKDAHFYYYNKVVNLIPRMGIRSLQRFIPEEYLIKKIYKGNGSEFILIERVKTQ
jgi:hypothetical protein